ncbi:hypothetical protein GCM10022230_13520 [Pseudoclavibacter caeni]
MLRDVPQHAHREEAQQIDDLQGETDEPGQEGAAQRQFAYKPAGHLLMNT